VPAQRLELVDVDRDVVGIEPAPEDDGRQAPGAAQVGDLLAGDLAMLCGEAGSSRGGGHAEMGLR
jgi:hypothetical protein